MLNLFLAFMLITLYIWATFEEYNDIKDRYESNNEKLNKAF